MTRNLNIIRPYSLSFNENPKLVKMALYARIKLINQVTYHNFKLFKTALRSIDFINLNIQ